MENSMDIPQNIKNGNPKSSSNSTTGTYIAKKMIR
jgi:hypothetical protein